MRVMPVAIALLVCPSLVACGEDAGLSFGALQGSYGWSGNGSSCQGSVSGSAVTGTCDSTELDEFTDYFQKNVTHWAISGTLGDSQISARVVETEQLTYWYAGECYAGTAVTTYEGSGSKSSGLSGTGPFAAMAGNWSASVSIETVIKEGTVDTTKDDCVAGRRIPSTKDAYREVTTWNSQAVLTAQTGTISRTRTSSDYWEYAEDGSIDYHDHEGTADYSSSSTLTATPSGDIIVDGYLVDKL